MKQAVMTSPGVIEFREVPAPEPAAGELLLRMKRIGVCGSDIHVYHGKHALTPFPVVQGHEVSGVVEKLGPGVRGFKPGERVTFQPQVFCGQCYPCTHGAYHICDNLKVMGFQTTGAASELFAVPAAKVLKLSPCHYPGPGGHGRAGGRGRARPGPQRRGGREEGPGAGRGSHRQPGGPGGAGLRRGQGADHGPERLPAGDRPEVRDPGRGQHRPRPIWPPRCAGISARTRPT